MERLTGLDASFLYLESNEQLMHVCALLMIDPDTMPEDYDFARMKKRLEQATANVAVFRRRLKHVPMDIDHPVWVNDSHFDIDQHVHRFGLPSPGDEHALAQLCGHLAGIPLDRARPMWEMYVIEGLDDGRVAVFLKMHHASIDGVSGANVLTSMCSLEADAPPMGGAEEWLDPSVPSDLNLLTRGLLSRALSPLHFAKLIGPALGAVADTIGRVREGTAMAAPLRAPRTSFNGTITGHRSIAFTDVPLARIKEIKNSVPGVTVNDVVLTLIGGALRRYLDGRGELPEASLLASVPVSVAGDGLRGSNHVSAMFTKLGTDVEDPRERLIALSEFTAHAKEHNKAIPAAALQDWAEFAAPSTFSLAGRVISGMKMVDEGPVIHNLIASNVPGPPVPIYFMGARIEGLYPFGPIMHGAGVNVSVISSAQALHVGVIACEEMVRHPFDITAGFAEELRALARATVGDGDSNSQARRTTVRRPKSKGAVVGA